MKLQIQDQNIGTRLANRVTVQPFTAPAVSLTSTTTPKPVGFGLRQPHVVPDSPFSNLNSNYKNVH